MNNWTANGEEGEQMTEKKLIKFFARQKSNKPEACHLRLLVIVFIHFYRQLRRRRRRRRHRVRVTSRSMKSYCRSRSVTRL